VDKTNKLSGSCSKVRDVVYLAPRYNTFVKDQVEAVAPYLSKVDVIVHHNSLTEYAACLPLGNYSDYLTKYQLCNLIDATGAPPNIGIRPLSFPYFIPDGRNKRLGYRISKKIEEKISRTDRDLIHAHFTWPMGYAGARIKDKIGVPLVITAHGFDIYDLPFRSESWRSKISYTLSMADKIITVSYKNVEFLKKLGIEKNVSVIPNGFADDVFFPRENSLAIRDRLGLPKNKKILLSIGNLEKVKGHEILLNALAILKKERDDIHLALIGIGTQNDVLNRLSYELGLDDRISFIGSKPHNEIPLWMNACDIFVLPSLNEGNPTVMFECLGCGKPFVGTKVGGVPEIITSERYGILSEPADPIDLAEKISIALDKGWDYREIYEYGKQYSWSNISKKIYNAYESLFYS
jgi:glycosyltransferase involved in cell wall biosynthesis